LDEPIIGGRAYVNPPKQTLIELHAELLAEFGGAAGIRDMGALEAALARPFQIIAYGDDRATIFDLAAALAFAVCRNHPFVDGNKRAALLALGLALGLNGFELDAAEREAADAVLGIASGTSSEAAFRGWVAVHAFAITDDAS